MRLIDADALMAWFNDHYDDEQVSVGFVSGLIKDAPTIDAVEVVRCRDCRHSRVYQTDSNGTMQTYCVAFVMLRSVTDDDFCSWGEREGE